MESICITLQKNKSILTFINRQENKIFGELKIKEPYIDQNASIIALKSATFKEAPPIKPPSISG